MQINVSVTTFVSMSYSEQEFDEQYEEYCRRYEEDLEQSQKKAMKTPHVEVVGMIWIIYGSQYMMIPFGKDLQVLLTKCSMEETLRNPSSTPWSTIL